MKSVELIIFDLDGTLINSLRDISLSLNFALKKLGRKSLDEEEVRGYIGSGVKRLLEDVLGSPDESRVREMMSLFQMHHEKHLLDNTTLYPGVKEILQFYKSKKKAVISNKNKDFSLVVLKGLEIEKNFDMILGPDDTERRKPFPDPIFKVLSELRVTPLRALMVGDNPIDIEAGKGAGVLTCAVTYGFSEKKDLKKSGPDFIIDDILDLKNQVS